MSDENTNMLDRLGEVFPKAEVHWRAQTLSRNNDTALALAYLDARNVMERLDEICGPENWSDSYVETPKGRVICTLSIRCGDEWISKSDGAGDTAVEGEKGAVSDALKRAAVKWGIGRYLYGLGNTWVPCETYKDRNGKDRWSKWSVDPWSCVKGEHSLPRILADVVLERMRSVSNEDDLRQFWAAEQTTLNAIQSYDQSQFNKVESAKNEKREQLQAKAA